MHLALHALCSGILVGLFPSWSMHFSSVPRVLHAPLSCIILLVFITLKLWTAGIHDWDRPWVFLSFLFLLPFSWVQMCSPVRHSQTLVHKEQYTFAFFNPYVCRYGQECTDCGLCGSLWSLRLTVRAMSCWVAWFRHIFRSRETENSVLGTVPSVPIKISSSVRPSVRTRDTTLEMHKGFLWNFILASYTKFVELGQFLFTSYNSARRFLTTDSS